MKYPELQMAFGLTGNIGCGKSTVARELAMYPYVSVFDCDKISKGIMQDPAHRDKINAILGTNVFNDPDAPYQVDTKLVARIIFSTPEKKKALEALIHPLVFEEVCAGIRATLESDPATVCIVESAIMFETGSVDYFGEIILVTCSVSTQFFRLKTYRNMSPDQIRARLASQKPESLKSARANYVINTDCSQAELCQAVLGLYQILRAKKIREEIASTSDA